MLKKSLVIAVFGGALAAGTLFRFLQMLFFTEYTTGFAKPTGRIPFYILFALIVLLAAAAAVFSYAAGPRAQSKKPFNLISSLFSFLLGIAVIGDTFFNSYSGIPVVLNVIYTVAAYLTSVYMILFAFRPLVHFKLPPMLAVLPPLLFTLKAATVFISYSYHAVISDTVFDVCVYCFSMLFFLETARAVNGAATKGSVAKITVFGLLTSFFAVTSSLPRLLLSIPSVINAVIGREMFAPLLHSSATGSIMPLFLGAYAACIVFSRVDFLPKKDRKLGVYYIGKH